MPISHWQIIICQKNECKCNVDDLWNRQKCIAKIFNRSPDLESVDELALKIEPLMYYTGEGAGNDMRECPDGNRNANISWAKKYKMEWTDVSLKRGMKGSKQADGTIQGSMSQN